MPRDFVDTDEEVCFSCGDTMYWNDEVGCYICPDCGTGSYLIDYNDY